MEREEVLVFIFHDLFREIFDRIRLRLRLLLQSHPNNTDRPQLGHLPRLLHRDRVSSELLPIQHGGGWCGCFGGLFDFRLLLLVFR